jgi:hypothetical protein
MPLASKLRLLPLHSDSASLKHALRHLVFLIQDAHLASLVGDDGDLACELFCI